MTDFGKLFSIKNDANPNQIYNPYAGKINGEWVEGTISVDFLNKHFGEYNTATEMKKATESEGLKLYFDWLVEQGKLPA